MFISSTFRDMQAERDYLVRFVFPKLRQELLQRRIHLVDVDLRWGVASEQDAGAVQRELIDECRPHFLCILGGRCGWVPPGRTRSIIADEVHYAVLDREPKSRGFPLFYFRDPSVTAAMVEVTPGEFREPAGSHGADALDELKAAIVEAGLQPFTYPAQWDDQSRRLIGLKEFGARVYADLQESIDQEFGPTTGEKPDEFTDEAAAMEAFIEERVQHFVLGSRESVLNELLAHANSTGGNGYACLTGAAGSGKSALLAKFCQLSTLNLQPSTILITHFVGASPGSTDVRRTLRRLCHELVTGGGLTAQIPEDPEKLWRAFAEILAQASAQKRVVILLDAINQFDPTTQLAGCSWLPEELPATVRIILSTLRGPVLDGLRQRRQPPRLVELQPLGEQDPEAIIREFLHRYRKILTDDQRAALLAKADAGNPLYLQVALEELRTLGTYEEITDRIAQLPPDTRSLFIWILKRLEDDDGFRDASGRKIGRELVSRFVSLLGASRHGLSQRELTELIDPGDPRGNVATLTQLLRPYLMQRGESLDFYHRQFREAVEGAYLASETQRQAAHEQLADYFRRKDTPREGGDRQSDVSSNKTAIDSKIQANTRVFLSYARGDDEPFVKRLHTDLTQAGFTVWIDRESLMSRGSSSFHQEIKDAIRTEVDRVVYVGGPKAAISAYVRQEWQFALECDHVVVTPILRLGEYDNVPGELSLLHCEDFRDDANYPNGFAKLAVILRQPNPKLGALFAVPSLPPNFLGRPELMRRLRYSLLVELQKPQVITEADARVGMQGMGGIGKSVLAAALARNRQVRQAYPDGVVWIACGQKLTDDDLLKRQRDLARHLGGDDAFASLAQGQGVLRQLLAAKAVLLVLDDVWRAADAQAFDMLGPRCRMLVTTRDKGILDALHGELVPVSLFTELEALQLLADAVHVAPAALPAEAREVARECGLLPLALALCGGMARKRGGDFHSVLERLRRADLEKIADRESVNEQHRSIWRAMHASVEMLPDAEQQRFAELSVFTTDQNVPEAAAATLWSHTGEMDDLDTEELLINFA
ncbi:MAG: NB-ARC domain-containing protein, partial [Verrucomicrobiota bacterium]